MDALGERIRDQFTQFCGPSVQFQSHAKNGRTITITYKVPAVDDHPRRVVAHQRNGLEITLMRAVRQCADSARNHAYIVTGHRDADMKQLLRGKLV